jgi:hypothetical protein
MLTTIRPWLLGLTAGLAVGAVLGAATVSRGTAGRADATLEARVAALEALTQNITRVEGPLNDLTGPHLIVEGVNVHIRSGSGTTQDSGDSGLLTGLGNLIVGYNELPPENDAFGQRVGSHNLVVGPEHRYTKVGGLVAGFLNEVHGDFATVSGGFQNRATGLYASVSGGDQNVASAEAASISGGSANLASAVSASVSGGSFKEADVNVCWRAGALNEGC